MLNQKNFRPMKSLKKILYLLLSSFFVLSCEKIEDISGAYRLDFNYGFAGPGITGTSEGSRPSITITQDEDIIQVDGNPGTIDSHNSISFSGDIVVDGTQHFLGNYDPSAGNITGSLTGTAVIDIFTGYSWEIYSVTITSGSCTLTPL